MPLKVSPDLNKIESHGKKLKVLSLEIVFKGVCKLSPEFESFPRVLLIK